MIKNTIDTSSSHLLQGDCIKVMKTIPDDSVDCIITDPPYNLGLFMHNRNTNLKKMRDNQFAYAGWDNMEYLDWKKCIAKFMEQCARVSKKSAALVVFMSVLKVSDIVELAQKYGYYYKTTGVWHKTNPMPRNMNIHYINSTECWIYFVYKDTSGTFNNNGEVLHDFIESSVCPLSEKKYGKHPTQKPLKIINELIKTLTNPNDLVLDPFMGSGSTCVSAALNNRRYIGIELNPEYHTIAKLRVNNLNELKK